MKSLLWRGSRRWVVGLTVAVTLAALGLVLGLAQAARADLASLDGSTKTASPDSVLPGNQLAYTIVVSNAGAATATPITVTDQLPPEVFYVSSTGYGDVEPVYDPVQRRVTWTISVMSANAQANLGLTVQVYEGVVPGSVFTNTAVISDGIITVEPFAEVTVESAKFVYFPIIMKRWPPVPYALTLSVKNNNDQGTYTLDWNDPPYSDATAPEHYWFQEARDAGFTDLTIDDQTLGLVPTEYTVTGRSGTLYYRVAGVNSYGVGPWSNVQQVTTGFYDDFSDTSGGWPVGTFKWQNLDAFDVRYENGYYRARIPRNIYGALNWLMGTVGPNWVNPYSAYDVQVTQTFVEDPEEHDVFPTFAKAGLIFGANADYSTFYVLEWNIDGRCSVNKYPNRTTPVSRSDIPREIYRDWGPCPVNTGYDKANTAKATVTGDTARVYLNGVELSLTKPIDLDGLHRVGILEGSHERTPVLGRFDDFRVTPR